MFDGENIVQEQPAAQESIFSQEGLVAQPDQEVVPSVPEPAPVESDKDKNFKELRIRAARAERERDEALARLQHSQHPAPVVEEPDDIGIAPDDIAEGKHISKLNKQLKDMRKQLDAFTQQSSVSSAETRLKMDYPDIDQVVSRENVHTLNTMYPELAASLKSNPDLYSKGVAAYTMIKKLGISDQDIAASERETVQRNINKPRPLASVTPQQSDNPLTRANAFANGMNKDLKAQLYKEMVEAAKNR